MEKIDSTAPVLPSASETIEAEILTQKDKYRQKANNIVLMMVASLAASTVVLTAFGLMTSDFNLALGALLGYAGNHTYQNFRTAPTNEIKKP